MKTRIPKKPKTAAGQIVRLQRPRRYVVVADSATARILREPGIRADGGRRGAALEEIARLDNPSAHQPARALTTDRTGRVFDSGSRVGRGPKSRARHGAQSDYDPHAIEVERFAKRLARRVDTECRRSRIDELILIAAPKFLGVLRPQLPAATRKLVTREIARDLTHAAEMRIRRAAFTQRQ